VTVTQQWRYLNLTWNSFQILFPAKVIGSYRQIICSRVAIGKPERQVRKASRCGSKQQYRSHAAITPLLLVRATYIWCCSSHTFCSWWITHSTQRQRRGSNNIPSFFTTNRTDIVPSFCEGCTWHDLQILVTAPFCCDRKARAASAQSFALWQQATIEITRRDHSIIACSRHIYMVVFYAHIPFVVNHTINTMPIERLQQPPPRSFKSTLFTRSPSAFKYRLNILNNMMILLKFPKTIADLIKCSVFESPGSQVTCSICNKAWYG